MKVQKRDGSYEELDLQKIREKIEEAYEGYDHLNTSDLEVEIGKTFYEGMETGKIHDILIHGEVDKIDLDSPEREYTSARLFLQKIYHEVYKNTHINTYHYSKNKVEVAQGFYSYLQCGVENHLNPRILSEYTPEEIMTIGLHIDGKRDLNFKFIGIKTLYDRYLKRIKNTNDIYELPQWKFMSNSMMLAIEENTKYNPELYNSNIYYYKKFREKKDDLKTIYSEMSNNEHLDYSRLFRIFMVISFYDIVSSFDVMTATPILSNANNTHNQMSSCFVGATSDNIEDIFDSYSSQAQMSKFGGGIGWYYNTRSKGDSIRGYKNASSGPMKFLKIVNDVAVSVDQTGVRVGSITVYLEIYHPNIKDFIEGKRKGGDERERIRDLFPAICIPDLFMERVEKNEEWSLISPYYFKNGSEIFGDEWREEYLRLENDENIPKEKISARSLWINILNEYFTTGNPFLFFRDNTNARNMLDNVGNIKSSNLCCFPGEQQVCVVDEDGKYIYKRIDELEEFSKGVNKFNVISSNEKTLITNKSEYEVKGSIAFKSGRKKLVTLILSDGGKWRCTPDHPIYIDNRKRDEKDLVIRDGHNDEKFTIMEAKDTLNKFIIGCTFIKISDKVMEKYKNISDIIDEFTKNPENQDFKDDVDLINYLKIHVYKYNTEKKKWFNEGLKVVQILESETEEDVYDLTVDDNHNFYILSNYNKYCDRLALVHNCEITIPTTYNKYKKQYLLEDKNGDLSKEYSDDDSDTLRVGDSYHDKIIRGIRYDKYEEGRQAVCTLSSINMINYDRNNTKRREFVVKMTTRLLDNIIDISYYPTFQTRNTSVDTRSLGIGVMNEHGMIANKKIYYNSDEHRSLITDIYNEISVFSIEGSIDLARERGVFKSYEGSKWSKGITPFIDWYENSRFGNDFINTEFSKLNIKNNEIYEIHKNLGEKIKKYGIRNGNLMAIAPTGSISLITGSTPSIEPVYNRKWNEENISGLIPVLAPNINLETYNYYESAYSINNIESILTNSIRQRFIDQSISFNVFIDKSKSVYKDIDGNDISLNKYISTIYRMAHKLGLKTTYYLRSKSPKNDLDKKEIAYDRKIECSGCQ